MNRITITEQDLTTNNTGYSFSDAIFIPGFAVEGAAQYGVPVRCSSLSEFNSYFGTVAPIFETAQEYPKYVSGTSSGFLDAAIPEDVDSDNNYMYQQFQTDLSWLLAKRLLSAGLPVIYVKMNQNNYSILSSGNYQFPGEWDDSSGSKVDIVDNTGLGTTSDCYIKIDTHTRVESSEALNESGGLKSGYEKLTFKSYYDVTVAGAYAYMTANIFNGQSSIYDKGQFDLKFICTGGYPTLEFMTATGESLSDKVLELAANRGDCVALLDHTNNYNRSLAATDESSVYYGIKSNTSTLTETNLSYGAVFTPWVDYSSGISIPASVVYLMAYAKSNIYNPSWLAIAGVQRGLVSIKGLLTSTPLTNTIADSYQRLGSSDDVGISINAITYINGYGYCIWGNRTLTSRAANSSGFATSTLNIRNLVSDVKKQARLAAISCMFEQNNDILWVNFKSLITPLLDKMVSGYGLKKYKFVKNTTTDKSKLSASIKLYPENTVESFDISIILTDEDADIQE